METETKTTPAEAGLEQSAPSFWQKLRHPFRYKFQFKIIPSKSSSDPDDPAAEDAPAKPKKEKKPKQKKEKKKKPKKEKKPKQKKEKGKGGSKKLILIIALVSVVLAAAICVVLLVTSGKSPESMLEKAEKYIEDQRFDDAIDIYNKLIETGDYVSDAYLGASYAYEGLVDIDNAIAKLEIGYEVTNDYRLYDRLRELRPEEELAEEEPPANQPIVFADPAFESLLRGAMEIADSTPIYQDDLNSVKTLKILGDSYAIVNPTSTDRDPVINGIDSFTVNGEVYTTYGSIRTLDDLAHFKNLTRLTIGFNEIWDISGLENQSNLQMLALYCNNISDINALSGCSNLQYLYLYNNSISNLSPLSGLNNLRQLLLQYNSVSDLSPLRDLTNLEELFVSHNQITDLSPVSGMSNLKQLFVSNNRISSISPLSGLDRLEFFYALDNDISDISPLSGLSALTDVVLTGNPVSDYSPVSHVNRVNQPLGLTSPY